MSDIAIRVENLSKRYRIGLKEEMHPSTVLRAGYTMVGAVTDFVRRPRDEVLIGGITVW